MLCKKREWLVTALPATALTDVSASVPPSEDANPEDTVEAISDPAAREKEAEVMPVILARSISCSLIRLSDSIDLTNLSYWKPCPPLGSVPSATRKKYLLSGWLAILIMTLAFVLMSPSPKIRDSK
jgi:hypothetical protein